VPANVERLESWRKRPSRAGTQRLDPFFYDGWKAFNDLVPEQNLVHIAHVKHIDYSAQIGATTIPPSKMVIDHEAMLDVNFLVFKKFFKLHAIK